MEEISGGRVEENHEQTVGEGWACRKQGNDAPNSEVRGAMVPGASEVDACKLKAAADGWSTSKSVLCTETS